ncbi:hypothetical protein [Aromatoleum diolicum]|nr:hypothetical protein [Aromatoleum diolicum]
MNTIAKLSPPLLALVLSACGGMQGYGGTSGMDDGVNSVWHTARP